jgi:hypothetical protein
MTTDNKTPKARQLPQQAAHDAAIPRGGVAGIGAQHQEASELGRENARVQKARRTDTRRTTH